jgi:signal transduction histidine kinase
MATQELKSQVPTTPVPCWMQELGKCVKGYEGRFLSKVEHCLPCEVFIQAAQKSGLSTTDFFVQQLHVYDQQIMRKLEEVRRTLKADVDELSVLLEISTAMQATLELDETLFIIMSGLTAGFALGFNRALLFLVDEHKKSLYGKLGVGPASGEEANRIWSDMSDHPITLTRMATPEAIAAAKTSVMTQLAQKIQVPITPENGILANTIFGKKAFLIKDAYHDERVNKEILQLLSAGTFATVPLMAKDKVVGVIYVDNIYTNDPIKHEDMQSLTRFAALAGLAIAEAQAYERIEHFTEKLTAEVAKAKAELQATEKELAHQEKLAALGEMAAGVAHELRNPMTAVKGFAQRIYRKLPEGDSNKKYASIIVEEMDRINWLIKDVLDFARKPDPVFSPNDIHKILEDVLFMFREDFKKFPIQIDKQFGDIPELAFDGDQIKQVFTNIIGNAIDAMEEGGTLSLRTRHDDKWVYIDVQDTGPGIWPEILKDIFNPFFTTKSTGTGLGLSNAHRLVELHGGDIVVDSRVGQGSTFTVKLPYRREVV